MKTFAIWYDNGSGYLDGWKLIQAESPKEALQLAGEYAYRQVATESWRHDPNARDSYILAEKGG